MSTKKELEKFQTLLKNNQEMMYLTDIFLSQRFYLLRLYELHMESEIEFNKTIQGFNIPLGDMFALKKLLKSYDKSIHQEIFILIFIYCNKHVIFIHHSIKLLCLWMMLSYLHKRL